MAGEEALRRDSPSLRPDDLHDLDLEFVGGRQLDMPPLARDGHPAGARRNQARHAETGTRPDDGHRRSLHDLATPDPLPARPPQLRQRQSERLEIIDHAELGQGEALLQAGNREVPAPIRELDAITGDGAGNGKTCAARWRGADRVEIARDRQFETGKVGTYLSLDVRDRRAACLDDAKASARSADITDEPRPALHAHPRISCCQTRTQSTRSCCGSIDGDGGCPSSNQPPTARLSNRKNVWPSSKGQYSGGSSSGRSRT